MRLTQGQKDLALRTVEAAFSRLGSGDPFAVEALRHALVITKLALGAYPTDRSCYSCDYEMLCYCSNNEHKLIPLPFRSAGCDAWKDEGAPF